MHCQQVVGVAVGCFPTEALNSLYWYTRFCTSQVQVSHHRRTRKAQGSRRCVRRRELERTGTCAVRLGGCLLSGPPLWRPSGQEKNTRTVPQPGWRAPLMRATIRLCP
jgi:hypothetical protein